MTSPRPAPVRCAIYTRKSSEEGLEQAFNSLDAQREACDAYIRSQAHEGWRAIATDYDDGGISGGAMERPALQRLLVDVDRGLVDTIVVYKIDRLTRSLADFARIVERLEAAGASFVSVTQAFNTTTSMGRLTLNVLLSFAQFEREVTGERIRDKIAASKKKGMWMGGNLPLGYDAPTDPAVRALVVNPAEAETVRLIFQTYLELGSVAALESHLDNTGVRSKVGRTRSGDIRGGVRLGRGALYHLLKNRVCLGEIPHRDESYPGLHPPIVPMELFDAVQARLESQRRAHQQRPLRTDAMLLTGLLFDAGGHPMSPAFGYGRNGKVYRYYVSAPLQQGRKASASAGVRRVAAQALEEMLRVELCRHLAAPENTQLVELLRPVRRLELAADGLCIHLDLSAIPRQLRRRLASHPSDPAVGELHLAVSCRFRGGRTWVATPAGARQIHRVDQGLIRGLRRAHRLAAELGWRMADGSLADLNAISPPGAHERRLCRLAFLAPDIQVAILEGRQPPGLTLDHLLRSEIPLNWAKQRKFFARA